MPYYIKPERRSRWEETLRQLDFANKLEATPKGDMTYVFYTAALVFMSWDKSYDHISDIIACMTDAAAELRRRKLDTHEDKKIIENGDIPERK